MKEHPWRVLFFTTLLLTTIASGAGPRNIFDDDWQPPKSSENPQSIPPQAHPPADAAPPAAPQGDPAHNPVPAPPPAAVRRSVPAKAEQSASRKVLKDVFAEQLTDQTIPARKKLTESLLAQAEKSTDAPVDEYVLLAAAIEAGAQASNLPLAFKAADVMAHLFNVDALAIKFDIIMRSNSKLGLPELADANVRAGLQLADQLVEAERFMSAGKVCAALVSASASNHSLRAEVLSRQHEVSALREAHEKVAAHFEKLKSSPGDPMANLEVGKYLCFYRRNWNAGLPALARGGDATLKALALRELAGATTADAQAALGDAWWDVAQTVPAASKAAVQAHAATWYEKAVGDLKGLIKARVDKRLAMAAPRVPAADWVVLFRSYDPRIWGKEMDRGKDDFSLKLTAAPEETKWLRLTCAANGKSVIIPITKDALSRQSMVSTEIGWEGTGEFALGASHLGIWSESLRLDRRGVIAVGRAGHDRRGWGFGRHHQVDRDQGYSWDGEELKGPVVFEIAVKAGSLTSAEQKELLVAP